MEWDVDGNDTGVAVDGVLLRLEKKAKNWKTGRNLEGKGNRRILIYSVERYIHRRLLIRSVSVSVRESECVFPSRSAAGGDVMHTCSYIASRRQHAGRDRLVSDAVSHAQQIPS